MLTDLHIHSEYAPNGKLPLKSIFRRAKEKGIASMAITDSYCIAGLPEASSLAKEYGIRLVKGVEMQADSRVHILAYKFDENNALLNNALAEARAWVDCGRLDRIMHNMKCLYNIDAALEEICALQHTKSPSTKQICSFLVMKGYANDWRDAKQKYFSLSSEKGSCYVGAKFSAAELVRLAKVANGIAVLAHPHQIEREEVNLDSLMLELVEAGLDGIEVYYNNQFCDDEKRKNALGLKEKYGLKIISGGSDFDGETVACLGGSPPISEEMVSKILLEE